MTRSRRDPSLRRFFLLLAVAAIYPVTITGYSLEVHRDFYDFAFGKAAAVPIDPPAGPELDDFREFFYARAARNPTFRTAYPSAASFDARAFKHFLALNPDKDVVGFDAADASIRDSRTAYREGSIHPDTDERNQDRVLTVDGKVLIGPDGKAIPYDPKTVWFGGRVGTASQFDAHGAMNRNKQKSGSYWVALTDPSNFSLTPEVDLGSAPEFSENYTRLAVLAKAWGGAGSDWLAASFAGNSFHGIEDLGNQIHTTLSGSPKFFVDAVKHIAMEKAKRAFRSATRLFGLLGGHGSTGAFDPAKPEPLRSIPLEEFRAAVHRVKVEGRTDGIDPRVLYAIDKLPDDRVTLVSVGSRILDNFHRLLEDYFEKSYLEARPAWEAGNPGAIANARLREVFERAVKGDAAFEAEARAAIARAKAERGSPEYARILALKMVEKSSPEAEPLYNAIRAVGRKELRGPMAFRPDAGDDPYDFVTTHSGPEIDLIFHYHGKAFARVVSALRIWKEQFDEETRGIRPGSAEAEALANRAVDSIVSRQLRYHQDAKARRLAYLREAAKATGRDPSTVVDPLEGSDPLASPPAPGPGILDALRAGDGR